VPPPSPQSNRKDPIIAGFLSLFIGLGYLHPGYRKVFGLPTILFVTVLFLVDVVVGTFTFGLVPLILAILLAYDGYVKARGEKGYIDTEPAPLYQQRQRLAYPKKLNHSGSTHHHSHSCQVHRELRDSGPVGFGSSLCQSR
jgi:hypothetical protein